MLDKTFLEPIKEFSHERAEMLAKLIESLPHTSVESPNGFNMSGWLHDCGTPCCISGWAATLMWQLPPSGRFRDSVFYGARPIQDFLGCDQFEANYLEYGRFSCKPLQDISPEEAATAIRMIRKFS